MRSRRPLLAFGALLALLAGGAAGRELEPGATLEGFPFSTAYSVAMTADGIDLYASGKDNFIILGTPGLAWLRRDTSTGALELRRNYVSTARDLVFGSVLSDDESHLVVLRQRAVEAYRRAGDGSLTLSHRLDLAADFRPQTIRRLAYGEILVVGQGGNNGIYALDANGQLVLRQRLANAPLGLFVTVLEENRFLSGGAVVTRQGGAWTWQPLATVTSAIVAAGRMVASPDRRYFYTHIVTGQFPMIDYYFITLERAGSQLIEVARWSSPQSFSVLVSSAAVHPQTGHFYVGAFNDDGGEYGTLVHYLPVDGGRSFVESESLTDPARETGGRLSKDSLTFSPDGRHLYASFDGEPMALFEIEAATGKPTHVPRAAGLHSRFERPIKLVSAAPGEAYVLTPHAILQSRWDLPQPELVSSLDRESWSAGGRPEIRDLLFTPDGGLGILHFANRFVLIERDPASGALRVLPGTSVEAGGVPALSADGRHLYSAGGQTLRVFEVRRESPALTLVRTEPFGGSHLRLSPNGVDGFLFGNGGDPLRMLRRSAATGELAIVPFPYLPASNSNYVDAFFADRGHTFFLVRKIDSRTRQIDRLVRQNGGWIRSARLITLTESLIQHLADPSGHAFVQLSGDGLDHYGLVGSASSYLLAPLADLDRNELGSVGAEDAFYSPFTVAPLAFLPDSDDLLMSGSANGNVRLFRRGCSSRLETSRCLDGERFRVEVAWRDADGNAWPAQPTSFGSDDAHVFTFFDPANWEMMVKVLDGCAINDRFWIYAAASTDVGFEIEVTDTWTGRRKIHRSPAGAPAPAITDGSAFATCGAAPSGWAPEPPALEELVETATLPLSGRFTARVAWTNGQGQSGQAIGLRTAAPQPSGLFYFFSPDNWELQVKVLDGCAINGNWWVFGAATTDVGYTLEVADTVTGRTRRYTNPLGQASPAITDISAFSCN